MAHKVADQVYSRITGEGGYFDSRVVFVAENGPKDARQKRLAIMDYDGANVQYLTDSASIVLAPRFSPTGDRVLYTSYETGFPADLRAGRGQCGPPGAGKSGRHDELCATLCARWAHGGLFADHGRQYRSVPDEH